MLEQVALTQNSGTGQLSANWPQVRPHINGNREHTSLCAEMYVCNSRIHVDCIQSHSAHDMVKWFRTSTIMSVPCMNTLNTLPTAQKYASEDSLQDDKSSLF